MTSFGGLLVAVVALLLLGALFSRPDRIVARTLVAVTVALIFIPTYGPDPAYVIAFNGVYAMVLLFAFLRAPRPDGQAAPRRLLVLPSLFLIYMAINESIGAGTGHMLSEWVRVVLFLLFGAVAIRDYSAGGSTVLKVLAWVFPLEFLIALAEQGIGGINPWPKGDANFDLIANRVNELVPWLAGRSVGTFGHPILLGTYAIAAFLASILLYRATKKRVYLLRACRAPVLLALSGTRSAAIAMAIVAAIMFAFAPGRFRAMRVLVAAAAIGVVSTVDILDLIGLGNISGTTSYLHRSQIIDSIPRLLKRSPVDMVFGSGGSSGGELFGSGVVRGVANCYSFDNEYVRVLAFAGVLGVLFFVISLVAGLIKNDNAGRLLLIAMIVMSASYDVFTWNLSYLLLFIGMAVPIGGISARTKAVERENSELDVSSKIQSVRQKGR